MSDCGTYNSPFPRPLLMSMQLGILNYCYRGLFCGKSPIDLAILSSLLWELKPRTIVEVGSRAGGSALWFGDQLRAFGVDGTVHSVDVIPASVGQPQDNVKFYRGDGNDLDAVFSAEWLAAQPRPLLVSEDADHAATTSLAVLRWFDRCSRPGEYIVVEDTNALELEPGGFPCGGPLGAVKTFMGERGGDYRIDRHYCDMFGESVTFFPNGYITRVR